MQMANGLNAFLCRRCARLHLIVSGQCEADMYQVTMGIHGCDMPRSVCKMHSFCQYIYRDSAIKRIAYALARQFGRLRKERVGREREEQATVGNNLRAIFIQFLAEYANSISFVAKR